MINFFNHLIGTAYAANDVIGTIVMPSGIPQEVGKTTDFVSAIIRLIIVIAGVFALWQMISGGLQFITSAGDKGKLTEAQNKITMSIIGLVIIAASFLIIAIVSQILFGNFLYILRPSLQSV